MVRGSAVLKGGLNRLSASGPMRTGVRARTTVPYLDKGLNRLSASGPMRTYELAASASRRRTRSQSPFGFRSDADLDVGAL